MKKYKIHPNELPGIIRENLTRGPRELSKTGFKGVNYIPRNNRYYARIWTPDRNKVSIGGFKTAEEAAKAYDRKMKDTVGAWVYTNFDSKGNRNA